MTWGQEGRIKEDRIKFGESAILESSVTFAYRMYAPKGKKRNNRLVFSPH